MERVADYAVFIVDPKGIILDWNHAAELMKGYPFEEAMGQFFGMLYPDNLQAEGHPRHNLDLAARNGTFQEEAWRKKKDGSLFWAHIELIAVYDEAGGVRGFCKLTRDLTARKELEDRLRQIQAQTENILEAAHAATWQWRPESGEVSVSSNFASLLGYEAGEIAPTADAWTTLVHPEDVEALQRIFKSASQGLGPAPEVEFRLRRKDGEYHAFYTRPQRAQPSGKKGSPIIVAGVMMDIQERKDAERERERLIDQVAAERARALAILEQLPVAVVLADIPSGTVIHYNGEAKRQFGSDLRLIGSEAFRRSELLGPDGSPIPSERAPLTRAACRGETVREEELHSLKEGRERYFSVNAAPIEDSDGTARVAVAVFTDIRPQKEVEAASLLVNAGLEQRVAERTRELTRANEVLLSSNEELQRFAYIASHDLQTPLRTITGFSQILQKDYIGRFDGQANEYINQVVAATHHMSNLIRDLLAYSRVNSQVRDFEPVDFHDIFRSVLAILAEPIQGTHAEITHGDLPRVMGDRSQLTQLLQNLVENGIKYHGAEPPRVHVRAERRGEEWLFSVRDNGIGIDARHREAIFEVFRRLHTQQAYPGTGIGLSVSRRVVERHGGRIWVESEPGLGSIFHFTLPVCLFPSVSPIQGSP